jgi:hypothetical protein
LETASRDVNGTPATALASQRAEEEERDDQAGGAH